MDNCNCSCEIVKLTYSSWNNGMALSAFVHLTEYLRWNELVPLKKQDCNFFFQINLVPFKFS